MSGLAAIVVTLLSIGGAAYVGYCYGRERQRELNRSNLARAARYRGDGNPLADAARSTAPTSLPTGRSTSPRNTL